MPQSLDPQLVAFEQQLYKGALVLLPRAQSDTGALTGKVLRFQYNPESINRTRSGEWVNRNQQQSKRSSPSKQADKLASAQGGSSLLSKAETISMKLVFDTTEQLLRGGEADSSVLSSATSEGMPNEAGVLPQLALLEQLGLGGDQVKLEKDKKKDSPQPEPPSEVLLVLGPARQFPVVVTNVTIDEKRFNAALVPTRAEVDIKMRVLEPVDVKYHGLVKEAFDQLVAKRNERLQAAPEVNLGSSGQLVDALYGQGGSLVRTLTTPSSQSDPAGST